MLASKWACRNNLKNRRIRSRPLLKLNKTPYHHKPAEYLAACGERPVRLAASIGAIAFLFRFRQILLPYEEMENVRCVGHLSIGISFPSTARRIHG